MCHRLVKLLYLETFVVFVYLAMIDKYQEEGDERVSDKKEEHIEQIFLKVERKTIKGPCFFINQVVVDQIGEESCDQHIN